MNVVAAAANDFNCSSGQVRYWTYGIAPTRVFVVEWNGVPGYSSNGNMTTQIRLYETTGIVEVHIPNASSTNNKVVGLQNANASVGTTVYSSTNIITNRAWRFTPGATYTYQWATAGSPISNANSGTYNTPALSNAGTVTYSVSATNPVTQCATSQNVNITVNGIPNNPQAQNSVQCGPGVPTASVSSSNGTPTYNYYNLYTSSTTNSSNLLSYVISKFATIVAATRKTIKLTNQSTEFPANE
jgi:hypothetical protein